MKVVKEVFISVLLLMVIIFTLGILFYDSMPNNKSNPTSITYTADATVTSTIQEISADTTTSNTIGTSTEEDSMDIGSIIASYSIGSSELSTYAARNTYSSGKVDPFAAYEEKTEEESEDPNNTSSSNNNGNTSNNNSTNTTSNSSTGKLFENKTTK